MAEIQFRMICSTLLLAVHPNIFFGGQVEGTILRCSCSFFFLFGPLLHAKKLGVGGPQDFTVSPRPLRSENLLGFGWSRPWGFQGLRVARALAL